MSEEKTITLVHPKEGEQAFPETQARKLMAMENNGGWEFKKPEIPHKKGSSENSTQADAAINRTDKAGSKESL